MRELWDESTGAALINRMLALDFRLTLADNDLPKVTRMCELAGVDVAFPMLHDPVIDVSLALPRTTSCAARHCAGSSRSRSRTFCPRRSSARRSTASDCRLARGCVYIRHFARWHRMRWPACDSAASFGMTSLTAYLHAPPRRVPGLLWRDGMDPHDARALVPARASAYWMEDKSETLRPIEAEQSQIGLGLDHRSESFVPKLARVYKSWPAPHGLQRTRSRPPDIEVLQCSMAGDHRLPRLTSLRPRFTLPKSRCATTTTLRRDSLTVAED